MKRELSECVERAAEALLDWNGPGNKDRYRDFVRIWLKPRLRSLAFDAEAAHADVYGKLLDEKADEHADLLVAKITPDDLERLVGVAEGKPLYPDDEDEQ